ncbi:hypothetical protein M1271_01300 [Patescibacteria group bacterium]|nr:hypothetical protein [Patescibacteria group bacterium]
MDKKLLLSVPVILFILSLVFTMPKIYAATFVIDSSGNVQYVNNPSGQVLGEEDGTNNSWGDHQDSSSSNSNNKDSQNQNQQSANTMSQNELKIQVKSEDGSNGQEQQKEQISNSENQQVPPEPSQVQEREITRQETQNEASGEGSQTQEGNTERVENQNEVKLNIVDGKLKMEGGKINDASNSADELDLFENQNERKITVRPDSDEYQIEQQGISANTKFPLSIDTTNNSLIVTTPAGTKVVAILPKAAVDELLQRGIIDTVNTVAASGSSQNQVSSSVSGNLVQQQTKEKIMLTSQNGDLVYNVDGQKKVKLFGLFPFDVNVVADVSAQTGRVTNINQPLMLKFLGFLFTS